MRYERGPATSLIAWLALPHRRKTSNKNTCVHCHRMQQLARSQDGLKPIEGREEGSEARARSYQAARLGRPGSARQALH